MEEKAPSMLPPVTVIDKQERPARPAPPSPATLAKPLSRSFESLDNLSAASMEVCTNI